MEHPVWQLSHLRVAAFAGVVPDGVGQGDHLLKNPENSLVHVVAAGVALNQGGAPEPQQGWPSKAQLPGAAYRADYATRLGCLTR